MKSKRIHLIVLDSVGIGEAPDAAVFHDSGAHTIGHIAENMALRSPHLEGLGLGNIADIKGIEKAIPSKAYWTKLAEKSAGKDTMTGHWEIAICRSIRLQGIPGWFSPRNCWKKYRPTQAEKSSATSPLREQPSWMSWGRKQMETGALIVYTSADPVLSDRKT